MNENTWQADSARFEGASGSADRPQGGRSDASPSDTPDIPADALILIPMRNLVLFPGLVVPLTVGRESSVTAAQAAARRERPVGIVLQRKPDIEALLSKTSMRRQVPTVRPSPICSERVAERPTRIGRRSISAVISANFRCRRIVRRSNCPKPNCNANPARVPKSTSPASRHYSIPSPKRWRLPQWSGNVACENA